MLNQYINVQVSSRRALEPAGYPIHSRCHFWWRRSKLLQSRKTGLCKEYKSSPSLAIVTFNHHIYIAIFFHFSHFPWSQLEWMISVTSPISLSTLKVRPLLRWRNFSLTSLAFLLTINKHWSTGKVMFLVTLKSQQLQSIKYNLNIFAKSKLLSNILVNHSTLLLSVVSTS